MKVKIPTLKKAQAIKPCESNRACKPGYDCDKCLYNAMVKLIKKLNTGKPE